jgi:hypothetical protein
MPDAIAGKRTKLREARLCKGCHCREENKLREARLCKGCHRREENKAQGSEAFVVAYKVAIATRSDSDPL